MTFTLTPEQEAAIEEMLDPSSENACLMGSDVGTGKTAVSVEFCKRFGARVVLVIAPLQTIDGWERHMQLLEYDLPFRQIDSTVAGKRALVDYQWLQAGVYFVGQEYLVTSGRRKEPVLNKDGSHRKRKGKPTYRYVDTGAWSLCQPDVVIWDEVHRLQNVESASFQVAEWINAKYKIGASGTPTGNSFDGAYATTRWLWPHRSELNIYRWRAKWAETIYDPFEVHNEKTVGELVPGAYFNSLPCYIKIESDLDIELDEKNIIVDLLPEQRRIYDELETREVAWIQAHPLVTKYPMTRRTRQRQITLAVPTLTPYVNKDGEDDYAVSFDVDAASSKIDRLWGVLDEDFEGEPALIFTDSQIFARVLAARINSHYGAPLAKEWSGKVARKARDAIKQEFIDGEVKYLVAVIRASGTGTDQLQTAARNMAYMSSDDSRIDNEQSVGRLLRIGQKADKVRLRRLLAADTIDMGQLSTQIRAALKMNAILKKKARRA